MESFERERTILEYLKTNNSESIENLAKICNSSSMTIRRDIKRLIELKTIEQRHGFVSLNRDISLLVPYAYRETLNKEVKKIMALKAIQLIEDGDVIVLDAGTSCIEIAYILNSKKNLTVITNDLNIANIVSNYDIEVYISGGKIENKNYCSSSIDTIKYIKKFRVSKAFIGTSGITSNFYFCANSCDKSEIKKTMINISNKCILMADDSKFNSPSIIKVKSLQDFDYIITNKIFSNDEINHIQKNGGKILNV